MTLYFGVNVTCNLAWNFWMVSMLRSWEGFSFLPCIHFANVVHSIISLSKYKIKYNCPIVSWYFFKKMIFFVQVRLNVINDKRWCQCYLLLQTSCQRCAQHFSTDTIHYVYPYQRSIRMCDCLLCFYLMLVHSKLMHPNWTNRST